MSESLIRAENLHYVYNEGTPTAIEAVGGVNLQIDSGDYVAIIGHNGSGKSTLAKCLNALLLPTEGDVWVNGLNTRDGEALLDIRATVGMVFQNPDNQFVATTVEEEIAFGPENLGVPRVELRERVDRALVDVGLWGLRARSPRTLSAGQKARLAIAGSLAMHPACLILDESTAMLDPSSRRDILGLLGTLNEKGLSIIAITHFMDEVVAADHVLVLEQGCVALQGVPGEVFAQHGFLHDLGLSLPPAAEIARRLRKRGLKLDTGILTKEDLVRAVVTMRVHT